MQTKSPTHIMFRLVRVEGWKAAGFLVVTALAPARAVTKKNTAALHPSTPTHPKEGTLQGPISA